MKEEGSGWGAGPRVSHHLTGQPWLVHRVAQVSQRKIGSARLLSQVHFQNLDNVTSTTFSWSKQLKRPSQNQRAENWRPSLHGRNCIVLRTFFATFPDEDYTIFIDKSILVLEVWFLSQVCHSALILSPSPAHELLF